jgi:hypothetical protein
VSDQKQIISAAEMLARKMCTGFSRGFVDMTVSACETMLKRSRRVFDLLLLHKVFPQRSNEIIAICPLSFVVHDGSCILVVVSSEFEKAALDMLPYV